MTKQHKLTILIFCIIKLFLHLIADYHSGFQGDELLHIETGNHLAFGFMEFPPLIGVVAFIQNLFASNSVYIHHLFSHISSILILIYVAKITIELGGKNRALFLALLCIIIAPGFGRSQQLFQPVVFGQLFWVLGFYQLVRYTKYLDKKYLTYLSIVAVVGVLFKYDVLFFVFGLSSLFFFKRTRTTLLKQNIGIYLTICFLFLLPNLYWQFANNFPVLQMFSRLYETQLDKLSRIENLKNLILAINPISLILVAPALLQLFKFYTTELYKPVVGSIVLSFLLLLFCNGKSYYFFPIVLTILPFGALFWEQSVIQKRNWVMYPIAILLFLGALLIPFGMPVYSFNEMLNSIQKYEHQKVEGGKYAVRYDEYYSKEKWETTMTELQLIYDRLPKNEKPNCLIWGKHYGQAGAVNLLGKAYHLPKAFSYHGSFYSWAPNGAMPNTVIALSYQIGDFFHPYFSEVTLVKTIYNPYADNEEELYQKIYICKKPKQHFEKMKELFKHRIFE
ncbi:Dolichyl-phosphate-mannose-protein mannosyltransferase [Flavobacterium sp. 9R]|uniref:ArnT family glycosyltransferase n=1 Tax=Flavobacterium sp. 9R TaxID=2653143 RepID=UPI0012EF49A4|nr:glycosyltransferase family 39 protein [Flavobacterium sp. 9R]VXB81257.1 Dolichyl-phosphate-mannose-protein mannosyltransferase [Flavobacterium sp. 9R]